MKIKEIEASQRPYERALREGVGALSDAELLAVILRTGTRGKSSLDLAQEVLAIDKGKNGLLNLMSATEQDLRKLSGLGKVKACEILCICELAKRVSRARIGRNTVLKDAAQVSGYFHEELGYLDYEVAYVMFLDEQERLIRSVMLSKGTRYETNLSPREVLRSALENGASAMILVHNHPSGLLTASSQDITLTRVLRQAGELMNIRLLDSVIIGEDGYLSLKEKGFI